MKKKIFKKILLAVSMSSALLTAGCSKDQIPEKETYNEQSGDVDVEIVASEENIVTNFVDSENAVYYLELDGIAYDISDYVVDSNEGFCTFRSSIMKDFFGFNTPERNETFLTFTNEEDRVQFEIGGDYILVNGRSLISPVTITEIPDSDEIAIPLDFVFGLGYDRYNTSRSGDTLYFQVGTTTDLVQETTEELLYEEESLEDLEESEPFDDTVNDDATNIEETPISESVEEGESQNEETNP